MEKIIAERLVQFQWFGEETHIQQNLLSVLPGLWIRIPKLVSLPKFDGSGEHFLLYRLVGLGKALHIFQADLVCLVRVGNRICNTFKNSLVHPADKVRNLGDCSFIAD